MYYQVKGEKFHPENYKNIPEMIKAAIKFAYEVARTEEVTVYKVDETGTHRVYTLPQHNERKPDREGWHGK